VRLRTRAQHAAARPRHRAEQAVVLLAMSTVLLGTATALASAAPPEPVRPVPVALDAGQEGGDRGTDAPRASRDRAQPTDEPPATVDPLPGCATTAATGHANGRLPAAALCVLPEHTGHQLRPDAARGLVQLAAAYEEWFKAPLCVTDSYRSLGSQQALAARKPGLAARPGTSEHGWGLAADLGCGVEDYDTPQHRWMAVNATRFGWGQPDWAKKGGARQEPWHWEYLAAA
jgi:hypothetical protein